MQSMLRIPAKKLFGRGSRLQNAIWQTRKLSVMGSIPSRKRNFSTNTDNDGNNSVINRKATNENWSEEWKRIGLGARLPKPGATLTNLLFVQVGFGVDQHGDPNEGVTKAAVRAVRNAIEFNSIPGIIECVPGGREEMLIQVKLGVPAVEHHPQRPMYVDLSHVSKVFPYGRLLPIEVCVGGLTFPTGRIVEELGDSDDLGNCVVACVSIGYDDGSSSASHHTFNTKDGF